MRWLIIVVLLTMAAICIKDLFGAWRTGIIVARREQGKSHPITLTERPGRFWIQVGFAIFLATLCLVMAWTTWHAQSVFGFTG